MTIIQFGFHSATTNWNNIATPNTVGVKFTAGSAIDSTGAAVSGLSVELTDNFAGSASTNGVNVGDPYPNAIQLSNCAIDTSNPTAQLVFSGLGAGSAVVTLYGNRGAVAAGDRVLSAVVSGEIGSTFTESIDASSSAGSLADREASGTVTLGASDVITVTLTKTGVTSGNLNAIVIDFTPAAGGSTGTGALAAQPASIAATAITFQVVTGSSIRLDSASMFLNLDFAPVDGDKVGIPRDYLGSAFTLATDGVFTITPALPNGSEVPRISYDASAATWYEDVVTINTSGALTIYASGALGAQVATMLGVASVPTAAIYQTFAEWIYNQPGLTGTVNDRLKALLVGLGYTGTNGDMLFKWLTDTGYTQATLPDKLYAWSLLNLTP